MSLYNATPTPPEVWEVPDAVKALLTADSVLTTSVGGSSSLHFPTDEWPKDPPTPATGEKWKRVLVKIPSIPGGLYRTMNRLLKCPIHIVTQIEKRDGLPDPEEWSSRTHARILYLLEGKTLSLTYAAHHLPIEQVSIQSTVEYSEQYKAYYQAAEYLTLLKPVD